MDFTLLVFLKTINMKRIITPFTQDHIRLILEPPTYLARLPSSFQYDGVVYSKLSCSLDASNFFLLLINCL